MWEGRSREAPPYPDCLAFLIGQNFFVDFKLLNQALDFLHTDLAAHDQAEARLFRQKSRR